jgi:hypothetical protein
MAEPADPYPKYLDWLRHLSACLLFTYGLSKLLGIQFMMLPVMLNILMVNLFFSIALGALCTSAFILASMLAILWHDRRALVDVFWTDQAGEPASVRRYYRMVAAAVVLLVIALMSVASWLHKGPRISR